MTLPCKLGRNAQGTSNSVLASFVWMPASLQARPRLQERKKMKTALAALAAVVSLSLLSVPAFASHRHHHHRHHRHSTHRYHQTSMRDSDMNYTRTGHTPPSDDADRASRGINHGVNQGSKNFNR